MKTLTPQKYAQTHNMSVIDVFIRAYRFWNVSMGTRGSDQVRTDYDLWLDTKAEPKYVADFLARVQDGGEV